MKTMKGSIIDIPFIVVGLFAVGLTVFIMYLIVNALVVPFGDSGIDTSYLNNGLSSLEIFDIGFPMIAITSFLISVMFAFSIRTHPAFTIASIIALMFVILLVTTVGNTFIEMENAAEFASTTANFPLIDFVWKNIVLMVLVFGAVMIVVMHGKPTAPPQGI